MTPDDPLTKASDHWRFQLPGGVTADVILRGGPVTKAALDLLLRYIALAQEAVGEEPEAARAALVGESS